jgi:hypothetical protein
MLDAANLNFAATAGDEMDSKLGNLSILPGDAR